MSRKVTAILAGILFLYLLLTAALGWAVFSWIRSFWDGADPWLFTFLWGLWAVSFLIGRLGHKWLYFAMAGSYWLAFFEYALLLVPPAAVVVLLTGEEALFGTGLAVALILLFLFLAGSFGAYSPVVREQTIKVRGPERPPLRIAVASDFHLGVLSGKRHLKRFVNRVNKLKPDLVLLAGDLVDDDPVWFVRYGMDDVMKEIQSRYGVYAVLGNHDYYGRKIPLLIREMKQSGVRVLMDETVCVDESFYITGREDLTNRNRKLLKELKPKRALPWIVMDHTPADLKTPETLGVDLNLSGHTHRGQMWPNSFFTRRLFELDYGYKKKGKTHFVVSSGFGFWGPPIRLGSRSEFWMITMEFEGK